MTEKDGYASSHDGFDHVGVNGEGAPPPTYSQVNSHVHQDIAGAFIDREFAYPPGAKMNEPWLKDDSTSYEGHQPYHAPHRMQQPHVGYPSTPGMADQPYAGYGAQSYGPYASPPGGSQQVYVTYPSARGNDQAYATTSLYAPSPPSVNRSYGGRGLDLGMDRDRGYASSRHIGLRSFPGPMSRRGGGGIISGALMTMATSPGQSTASLLDPPPPSFLRSARPGLSYEPFEPSSLSSLSEDLNQGFPQLPPQSQVIPHPFASHDISEDDWRRFVCDLKSASTMSQAAQAPSGRRVGLLGTLLSVGMEQATKGKKSDAVSELVDQWNMNFFHPRQMTVVLARGSKAYSGAPGIGPPDMMTSTADARWRLVIAYRPCGPERGY